MRYILLFITAMALQSVSTAQHFTDSGNTWIMSYFNWELEIFTNFQIKIDADTLIQNQAYKTLLQADDAYNPNWHSVNYFLREDDEKIVYILDSTGQEGILYDFGLDVGQQVVLWNDITVTVKSIDSVQVANNQMQRRLKIGISYGPPGGGCTASPFYWIDDVGGPAGPVPYGYSCLEHDIGYGLGCLLRNDEIYYSAASDGWCEEFTTASIPVTEIGLSVFPNPVLDELSIQFTDASDPIKNVQMYNSQGQIVYHQIANEPDHRIDMSQMASGIYFLEVISEDHKSICKKIFKL
jgi:hypothetical protein